MPESGDDRDIRELWPEPPKGRVERIRHFLDQWVALPDDYVICTSTLGVYGRGRVTGVTIGDLRKTFKIEQMLTRPGLEKVTEETLSAIEDPPDRLWEKRRKLGEYDLP